MNDKQKADNSLHADAWKRFERAIDVVAKSPPQHRTKGKKSLSPRNTSGATRGKKNQSRP